MDSHATSEDNAKAGAYHRYHIRTQEAPDRERWPSRFKVHVRRSGLAKLLIKEVFHYGPKNKDVILSRPCMYGVFSGPVGGFAPREEKCVGCLRCTTEFPDFVRIEHNPARRALGDSYFGFGYVDAISYEAANGLIPVKGAGYRGRFGGEGWDGMWTDMSEIVRPTRDGIHGREFISTVVDIGFRPNFLQFDERGRTAGATPQSFSIPLPMLFDAPPAKLKDAALPKALASAAAELGNLAFLPVDALASLGEERLAAAPLVSAGDDLGRIDYSPRLIAMDGWDAKLHAQLSETFPQTLIALRTAFDDPDLLNHFKAGVRVFHLTANYHGRSAGGDFVIDLIRAAHARFVEAGIRQEVTLLGSGGMIAAEHVPKAIICGLDAVVLDTPLMVALQATFNDDCVDRDTSDFGLPRLDPAWGAQRLENLMASWRDQLLEILGAMGLREVRRLRGEMGRAMFMKTLEADAFAGIEGYHG